MPTTTSRPEFRLLRTALLANAAFSILSGVTLAAFALPTAKLVGNEISSALILGIGIALVPFGAIAAWVATRRHPPTHLALAISVGDLSWVVASLVVVVVAQDRLTSTGLGLIVGIALAVLAFAIGQLRGIARVYRSCAGDPRGIRVCIEVRTPGDAQTIWQNVADMGNISRFAPMLATSAMRDGASARAGAVRECSDHACRRWAERCLRLDGARRELEVEFLADEPGFPFPFATLRGGWRVSPESDRVAVTIWWEGTLRHAVLASVLPPLFAWQAQRQFSGVIQHMAGAQRTVSKTGVRRPSVVPC